MRVKWMLAGLAGLILTVGRSVSQPSAPEAVIVNGADAPWAHDAGDPPGTENVMLRGDGQAGGLELLVRFPAGHVFAPHWHDSNERILVLEGRLAIRQGEAVKNLDSGGFAFLPARQVQRLSCVSKTRCEFYIAWDGKPGTHKAPAE
jgi:quercetin dioxygenase-like cupin family protein